MQKIKIELPENILYTETFPITDADINIANHMGNERVLVFANTIRENMFKALQLNMFDLENQLGIVIANHIAVYKAEGFLGDNIKCEAVINEVTECSFNLIFHFIKENGKTLALLSTLCVFFDFNQRKIKELPSDFVHLFGKK